MRLWFQRLKLLYHKLLSSTFAFNFNLRRYGVDRAVPRRRHVQQERVVVPAGADGGRPGWTVCPQGWAAQVRGKAVQVDSIKTRVETAYGSSA